MAAIERFNSDQESFKKKLSEFDDDCKIVDLEVEEIEKKMTGMLNESKTGDDVEKQLNDDLENSENAKDLFLISFLVGTIMKAEYTDPGCNDKVEAENPAKFLGPSPLAQRIDRKISTRGIKLCNDDDDQSNDVIQYDFETNIEELELDHLIEVRTRVTGMMEEVVAKFQQLKLELAELDQSIFEAQTNLDLANISTNALLTGDTALEDVDEKLKDQSNNVTQSDFQTNIAGPEEESYKLTRKLEENVERKTLDRSKDSIDCDHFTDTKEPEFEKSLEEFKGKEENVMKKELDEKQKKNNIQYSIGSRIRGHRPESPD
ncbi:unnamed protein product [Ilex paraguariensis]|uniref:Uncharacterized protein n=1 Tax=Ilex paraguariensis TaxID=185542 RepID=A0ABC8R592_9AQUA